MKTIGILGGISWQSTASYYKLLNEEIGRRLGGHHCADLRVWSGDFEAHHQAQLREDHDWIARELCEAATGLVSSGSDVLVIASNTAHQYADLIEAEAGRPVVNIIDATAHRIRATGMDRVLLLGTGFTMTGEFYTKRMEENGVDCLVPDESDRSEIHRIIFEELVFGRIDEGSHRVLVDIIDTWADQEAEGVILGCTELGLILDEDDARIPGFDTTRIHCLSIVDEALGQSA